MEMGFHVPFSLTRVRCGSSIPHNFINKVSIRYFAKTYVSYLRSSQCGKAFSHNTVMEMNILSEMIMFSFEKSRYYTDEHVDENLPN